MSKQVSLKLPEELHARIRKEAEQRRSTPVRLIEQALEALARTEDRPPDTVPAWITALTPEERAARVDAAFGAFAHIPLTVDEYLREKHADAAREEERWERHFQGETA